MKLQAGLPDVVDCIWVPQSGLVLACWSWKLKYCWKVSLLFDRWVKTCVGSLLLIVGIRWVGSLVGVLLLPKKRIRQIEKQG